MQLTTAVLSVPRGRAESTGHAKKKEVGWKSFSTSASSTSHCSTPAMLYALSALAAIYLLVRPVLLPGPIRYGTAGPRRRLWIITAKGVAGGAVAGAATLFSREVVLNVFGLPLEADTRTLVIVAFAGVGLAVVKLWRSRWWRKVAAGDQCPVRTETCAGSHAGREPDQPTGLTEPQPGVAGAERDSVVAELEAPSGDPICRTARHGHDTGRRIWFPSPRRLLVSAARGPDRHPAVTGTHPRVTPCAASRCPRPRTGVREDCRRRWRPDAYPLCPLCPLCPLASLAPGAAARLRRAAARGRLGRRNMRRTRARLSPTLMVGR
ncbi:hypothetical protein BJQ90_03925 [Arthrobacter sp. SO3]|nr:hypothetical protein [Arthrobacter sp. SO3]